MRFSILDERKKARDSADAKMPAPIAEEGTVPNVKLPAKPGLETTPTVPTTITPPRARAASGSSDTGTSQAPLSVQKIPLDSVIDSQYQPRTRALTKRDVEELMRSITVNGQTAPIIVTPSPDDPQRYYVHAGHRRCAALRFLDATTVQAIVRTDLNERALRKLVVGDNLGRADLSAVEQANALEGYCKAFALSVEDAANELGIARRTAYRLSTVLSASEDLKEVLREEALAAGPSELLARIDAHDSRRAVRLARKVAAGTLSNKALQAEVKNLTSDTAAAPLVARTRKDVEVVSDARRLRLLLDLPVDERTPAQVARAVEAISQALRNLGVARVDAA